MHVHTYLHTLVCIYSTHTCTHLCTYMYILNHTQPKSSKAPVSRRCHFHLSVASAVTRFACGHAGEGIKVQTKHCSLPSSGGQGRGGAAGGHRTHVPTAHRGQHGPPSGDGHRAHMPTAQRGWQGPPSGSFSGLGAPGLLQHSSSCQTSTLLEIQNTQPLFPEDWCRATGPDCRASGEPGLPRWGGLF